MAVLQNFVVLSVLIITAATVDVASLKRELRKPVNRLEGTKKYCLDQRKRKIPLELSSCRSFLAFSDAEKELRTSNFDKSAEEFVKELPSGMRSDMHDRIKGFDQKFNQIHEKLCAQNAFVRFYCQFELNDVVFWSGLNSSLLAVCASCAKNGREVNKILTAPTTGLFLPAEGFVEFKIKNKDDHGHTWPITYTKDKVLLQAAVINKVLTDQNHFAVRLNLKMGLERDGYFPMNLTYETFWDDVDRTCTQKEINFHFERMPREITMITAYCTSDAIPMLWVPRIASERFLFEKHDGYLRLTNDAGTYLLYCKYVYVAAFDDKLNSLCGRLYFLNGTSGGVIDDIAGAYIIAKFTNATSTVDKCNLGAVGFWYSESIIDDGKLAFLKKRTTMILCLCRPSHENPECDDDFKMNPLDQATMDKIPRTMCEVGPLNSSATKTGFFGFCTLSPTEFTAETVVESTRSACNGLNHDILANFLFFDGKCYFCCFANPSTSCNLEFRRGGRFFGIFWECGFYRKFGPPKRTANVYRLPEELPYAEEVIFPRGDLMDSSLAFEELMGYFQINLTTMLMKKMATVNPVAHAYSKRAKRVSGLSYYKISPDLLIFNNQRLYLCAYSKWTMADLLIGCRCFVVDETELNCCCTNGSIQPALELISRKFVTHHRKATIDESLSLWSYRETLAVNRTVIPDE